ncbi:MAG: nitroreductase family protein [Candidatus Thorarchaeota archaeon]|nr:nitroreductase family protein [Candidatus Thorarchaeota archaeon]
MTDNIVLDTINNRRSIREYLDKQVSDEVLSQILEAGFRAPFAAQLCSVIYTRSREKMKKAGVNVYPTAPIHMIYFIDLVRLEKIMKHLGYEYGYDDMMAIWLGMQDVVLMIENLTIAAESLGLGSVLYGLAPIRADSIAKTFNVPKRVFPVVGMSVGYPDPVEETVIRPRFPLEMAAFEDEYRNHTDEDIKICMKGMDEGFIAQGYYIKAKTKVDLVDQEDTIGFDKYSWSEHISRKFRSAFKRGDPLIDILRRHGFDLR